MAVDKYGKVENRPIYKESDNAWVSHEVFMGPKLNLFHVMEHLDRLQFSQTGLYSLNIRTNESNFHG